MIYAKGQDSRLLISKDVEFMNPHFSSIIWFEDWPPKKPFGNWCDQFYWLLRVVLILRFWVVLILALKLPRAFQEYYISGVWSCLCCCIARRCKSCQKMYHMSNNVTRDIHPPLLGCWLIFALLSLTSIDRHMLLFLWAEGFLHWLPGSLRPGPMPMHGSKCWYDIFAILVAKPWSLLD